MYSLAQINIGRLQAPLDDPCMAKAHSRGHIPLPRSVRTVTRETQPM